MQDKVEHKTHVTAFAPHLAIQTVRLAMQFYEKAFGASVIRKWENPDGTVHVAEMEILGAMFHLHEETARSSQLSPENVKATTVLIGLFTPDPDKLFRQAVDAGAVIQSPCRTTITVIGRAPLSIPLAISGLFRRRSDPRPASNKINPLPDVQ